MKSRTRINITKFFLPILVIGAALGSTTQLSAAEAWYVGVGVTTSNSNASGRKLDKELSKRGHVTNSVVDDRDYAGRIYAGLKLTKHLGVEVEYIDLGDVTSDIELKSGNVEQFAEDLNELHPVSASALTLAATLRLPIDNAVDWLFRLGPAYWKGRVNTAATNGDFRVDQEDSGFGYFVGTGLWINDDGMGLRLGYDWYWLQGSGGRPTQRIGVVNASIEWWFGESRDASWEK